MARGKGGMAALLKSGTKKKGKIKTDSIMVSARGGKAVKSVGR